MAQKLMGNVLVVDDQDNWRDAIIDLLSQDGHTTESAKSFEEAVQKLSEKSFDIAILDVRLVDQDILNIQGVELLKQIKARAQPPKVVILTGYPESIREGILEKYDADALVLKVPSNLGFSGKEFKERIQSLLAGIS